MPGLVNNASELPEEVDVIVVGAGAAGCVLAARLSEDPNCSVLALEAGERLDGPEFTNQSSAIWLHEPESPWFWEHLTTPQAALGGRAVSLLTGRALGGGSAVNSMVWLRGHPVDYDSWAKAGASGWGWDSVLPVFRAIEKTAPRIGGADSPMALSDATGLDVFAKAFIAAGGNQGLKVLPYIDADDGRAGFGPLRSNAVNGKRHSVIEGYLQPALGRPNLTVATASPVARLLTAGKAVNGVQLADSTRRVIRARRTVVLTAGALRTPQLMMLSGIGPAAHLAEHGIATVHDLPGVGANLQDHPLEPIIWPSLPGIDPPAESGHDQQGVHFQAGALLQTDPDTPAPNLQLSFVVLRSGPDGTPFPQPIVSCMLILLTPRSRGTVRLASADPGAPPLVDPAYLSDGHDRESLRDGLVWVRDRLFDDPALRALCGPPMAPAQELTTDEALDTYLAEEVRSTHHPVGTCRMGTGEGTVVGPDLAVHGIRGLHIADASIMPSIVRGNPHAATIMIAERAARLLREP
ncbi:GMC family oxidoreductase N-terminal domain-containing protein [Actinospica durhamensis]|uniref:GMC family oxidoreductase N-terminal domain-containing protein n=1 Tax=Actinospica durhamensis TaxID=1508375 RepID=A0A941IR46_9ACTN|nr:GMC family oxidoreductase N-terminal domain-containing protein [Actinospica durhamensis]MBR7831926.1 GMC family oxidoreductase N-terminal domain-containing protein [Actinospica durhamensis]